MQIKQHTEGSRIEDKLAKSCKALHWVEHAQPKTGQPMQYSCFFCHAGPSPWSPLQADAWHSLQQHLPPWLVKIITVVLLMTMVLGYHYASRAQSFTLLGWPWRMTPTSRVPCILTKLAHSRPQTSNGTLSLATDRLYGVGMGNISSTPTLHLYVPACPMLPPTHPMQHWQLHNRPGQPNPAMQQPKRS